MAKVKLIIVGGFLGAGKTTAILALARRYMSEGKKIGVVTNDQGTHLVDTLFLRRSGLPVLEVTGGCFCCNFSEFTKKIASLADSQLPDIILAEPVGSCTDLIASIFSPMQSHFADRFTMMPLSIVADPRRVRKIMQEENSSLFPSEISYLFRKQLEEADLIILNKADMLSEAEASELRNFLAAQCKGARVYSASALHETGLAEWMTALGSQQVAHLRLMDINYETYAKAEEYLGWLNSSVSLSNTEGADLNAFIVEFMETLRQELARKTYEIAHIKTYCMAQDDWCKASLTALDDTIEFSRRLENVPVCAHLLINARINMEPDVQKLLIESVLEKTAITRGILLGQFNTECFKPGRPSVAAIRLQGGIK